MGRYRDEDIKRVTGTVAAVTDATVIAAVAGKHIRVIAAVFSATANNLLVTLRTGAAGTPIWTHRHSTGEPFALDPDDYGWFQTDAGDLLELSTSGATPACLYNITYVEAGP